MLALWIKELDQGEEDPGREEMGPPKSVAGAVPAPTPSFLPLMQLGWMGGARQAAERSGFPDVVGLSLAGIGPDGTDLQSL